MKQFEVCVHSQVIQAHSVKCIKNQVAHFLDFPITKEVTK